MRTPNRDIKNLVWIQTAFLGDIILTTGAISLAHKAIDGCRQVLVTTKIGSNALRGHPHLNHIHAIEKKNSVFIRQAIQLRSSLKAMGFSPNNSIVLQVHQSFRSTLLSKILGIQTITYRQSDFSSLSLHSVERIAVFHEVVRIAMLLEQLGVHREEIIQAKPSLSPSETCAKPWCEEINWTRRTIGISAGATWATKQWRPKHFKTACEALLRQANVDLVFLGSASEKKIVDSIINEIDPCLKKNRIINLAGKTSLSDLRFIYPRLTLLISNDSSPIHYASSFGTPVVAIFGATTSHMGFGPLSTTSRVIELGDLPCRPCSAHGPKKCPLDHFDCMNSLKPQAVIEACENILKNELLA